MKLPDLPAGFTPAFLTDVLHQHGALPGASRVATVNQSQVGDGTGMMAELARLEVTYDGEAGEAPASFIAKFASRNETNRAIGLSYNLYERETRFVSELDPQTSARTPLAYCSILDHDRFLILMEDMLEYEVGDQVIGATLEQSRLAVGELAKLHSAFWNRVGDLDWVPHVADSYHANNMHDLAHSGFDGVLTKFADYVPQHLAGKRDAFLGAIRELQARMNAAPLTLCHGDFRMANFLYGCKPDQDPIAILDWQGPLRGRGMVDVALLLAQSTQTEVRRQHERALLDEYQAGLEAGGVSGLNRDALWEDYRNAVLYSWVYVFVVAGNLDSSSATAFAWMAQMVARQATAADDLAVYDLLP